MATLRALALSFLSVSVLAGCSKSGTKDVPVKGKLVTAAGTPFQHKPPADKPLPPGDPGVRVKFTSLDAANQPGQPQPSYIAKIDPDTGTFEVPGPKGDGIPAGKYRVTVYVGAIGANPDAAADQSIGVPPTVENSGADDPGLDGKQVAQTDVTVPPEGAADLTVTVDAKK